MVKPALSSRAARFFLHMIFDLGALFELGGRQRGRIAFADNNGDLLSESARVARTLRRRGAIDE